MTATVQVRGPGAAVEANLPFIISASSVGTLIEWFDFYLYGVLAVFFSKHFFSPAMDPNLAFIASLAVFWTGFLVRPFGAIVFGHLGDLIGRKFTFMLTLLLMGAATFVVGLLPGYDSIGVLAPSMRPTENAGSTPRGSRPPRRWASCWRCWSSSPAGSASATRRSAIGPGG